MNSGFFIFAAAFCGLSVAAFAARAEVEASFSLAAPSAKEVFLAGEFNHWSKTATSLQRGEDGK